jgi:hypothetical protein
MISSTRYIAAALPIKPILEVFSRRCGVSDMTDAGIAIINFLFKGCGASHRLSLSAFSLKVTNGI